MPNWKGSLDLIQYKIELTEPAAQDLEEIMQYISGTLREPNAAKNLLRAIQQELSALHQMPERHPLIPEDILPGTAIRRLFVKNYTVFFTVDSASAAVTVLRILYSRRDWRTLLENH